MSMSLKFPALGIPALADRIGLEWSGDTAGLITLGLCVVAMIGGRPARQ